MSEAIGLVGVAAAILATVQIANDFYRLVTAIREIDDPRVKIIQYNLITQRQRVISWAHRIQLEGTESWKIPAQSSQDVETILREMTGYFQRAEDKMAKIYRAPGGRMTSRLFMHRFLFANGGFQELKELTEALTAMNEALKEIAPPLPAYSLATEAWNRPTDVVIPTSTANSRTNVPEGTVEADAEATKSAEGPTILGLAVSISALYNQCLDTLVLLSLRTPDDSALRYYCDRLRLWGIGLFKPASSSLDTIFRTDESKNSRLKEVIIRALVYIAVMEGMVQARSNPRVYC
jgi:hypothetical protein